ncbi:MAG: hypothetical protein QXP77_02155 [Candidatus Aenigmatarchaeota archaeon]
MKGISPLVAAVLLIAATMSIAGILAYWAASFVRSRTETMGNETQALERCTGANFDVLLNTFNATGNNELTIILENKARYPVYITGISFIWTNGTILENSTSLTLNVGETFKAYTITHAGGKPVEKNWGCSRYIITTDCPGLSKSHACDW